MADVRTRLLKAAEALVDTGGLVSLDATAERAGVGRSTAYRHFSGRQDLLLQVANVRSVRLLDRAMEMVAGDGGATERLAGVMAFLFSAIPEDPVLAAFAAEGPRAADDPTTLEAAERFLAPLVIDGQLRGEFRTDYPPSEAVRWIIAQLFTALQTLRSDAVKFREWFEWFILPSIAVGANPSRTQTTTADALRDHARALVQLADRLEDDR